MEILFCKFGGLGESAIERSFKRLGHHVVEFNEKAENYDYDERYMNRFIDKIQGTPCDMIFSINFLPLISKISKIFRKTYIS